MPNNIMPINPRGRPPWPPVPDPCDCGGPGWPDPPFPAFMECWQQVAQFKAMVQQIVLEMPADALAGSSQFTAAIQGILDGMDLGGAGTSVGVNPPSGPTAGQLWWDGMTLRVWDGSAWVPDAQTRSYVQVAAPTSPNPGDTWWNGTVQRIWNGTAWVTVGTTGAAGVGVTDGGDASPGQIGEYVRLSATPSYTTAAQTITVPMGTLPAGDWDVWWNVVIDPAVSEFRGVLYPALPPGFNDDLYAMNGMPTPVILSANSAIGRALTSAPTSISLSVMTNSTATGAGAGNMNLFFNARRMR